MAHQAPLPFDMPRLPSVSAVALELDPAVARLVSAPARWPGRALVLDAREDRLVCELAIELAGQPGGRSDGFAVLTTSAGRFASEADAFVALSSAERGVGQVLVLSDRPAAQLDIALPDLRSRLQALATVSLPEPTLGVMEQLSAKLLDAAGLRVKPGDLAAATALLPARLSAVHDAVMRLLESGPGTGAGARDCLMAAFGGDADGPEQVDPAVGDWHR
jgi:hypothetical protein